MKTKKSFLLSMMSKGFIVAIYAAVFIFFLYMPRFLEILLPTNAINVCAFAETFSKESIDRFERETGIKVNITYAEIDEQIYSKFRINEARDYDVVNASDFMIHRLAGEGFLQELDHTKISNIAGLDKRLMNRSYDSGNIFSVPHAWYVYGIIYDKSFFNCPPDQMSLDFIFKDPRDLVKQGLVPAPYKLCMLDDGRDASFMAAQYLFGRMDNLKIADFVQIGKLLVKQKKWVEAYTVHSSQFFLFSDATPLALMSSNYVRKILKSSDRFEFAVPKEGSMLIIENLAIPKKSCRTELAHMFINYMISDAISAINCQAIGYNSSNLRAQQAVLAQYSNCSHILPQGDDFERLTTPLLPQNMRRVVEEIWLAVEFA